MLNDVALRFFARSCALKNIILTTAILCSTTYTLPALADSHQFSAGSLTIENTFTFATPPGAMTAGGYLTITNTGTEDDTLTCGSASFSKVTQVHEMTMTDGVMKMRHLDQGLKIPAGESVTLKPGGLHMMFMQLTEQLIEGSTLTGTLMFSIAGEVPVEFTVMNRSDHMSKNSHKENAHQSEMKHNGDHSSSMKSDN